MVRLCWAPVVADPGAQLAERIRLGRQQIIQAARSGVYLKPRPPEPTSEGKPARVEKDEEKEDKSWSFGGRASDVERTIDIPADYIWNGSTEDIIDNTTQNRTISKG